MKLKSIAHVGTNVNLDYHRSLIFPRYWLLYFFIIKYLSSTNCTFTQLVVASFSIIDVNLVVDKNNVKSYENKVV